VRLASVDFGRRRIGLAVCDPLGIAVRGLPTVVATGTEADAVAAVAKALDAEGGVERVVVGLPLHEGGRESASSAAARRFGAALGAALGREVVFFDEGLTTWEAEEDLKARGKRLRDARRSGEVDRAAAVAILRSYLRHLESGGA
jgi:putative Holliday junction resolvase